MGDSVAFGSSIRIEDTFLSIAEEELGVEIIKAGVNGYEFDQQLSYYEDELFKYDADIILMNVVLNDVRITDPDKVREDWFGGDITLLQVRNVVDRWCRTCSLTYTLITNLRVGEKQSYNDKYFIENYELWNSSSYNNYQNELKAFMSEIHTNLIS